MSALGGPLLAAALIVRNEEANLSRCLGSLVAVCDEMVVVDTGSTDDTVEVARAFGASVHEVAWPGSFAAARNVALSRVHAEWTLVIDADEEVVGHEPGTLRAALGTARLQAAWVRQRPRIGWTACDELRLVRNRPELRYEGLVHESLWPALQRLCADPTRIGRVPLELQHHGYETPEVLVEKAARDLPLIETELASRPDDTYLLAMLGKCLARLGRRDEAIEAFEAGTARGGFEARLLLLQLQHGSAAGIDDALLHRALADDPDDVDLCWLGALRARELGDHRTAVRLLQRILAVGEDRLVHRSRPVAQVGTWAWELLGRSALSLGRAAEARDAFLHAAADPDSSTRCRALARLAERVA